MNKFKKIDDPTHVYIAYNQPCGCPVGSCVYNFQLKKHTGQTVKEWIVKGYIVQSFEWEKANIPDLGCTHGEPVSDKAQQPALL